MTLQSTVTRPKWRYGREGEGSGSQLLTLRDEADLAFVFEVVADITLGRAAEKLPPTNYKVKSSGPCPLIYLTDWRECPTGLNALWSALRVECGHPTGVSVIETNDGRLINFVDAPSLGRDGTMEAIGQVSRENVTFVNGAELIDEPVPDICLGYWRDVAQKSSKRKPYLCSVSIGSYSIGSASLFTQLSPKWWTLQPAYEIIRSAKNRAAI